ncbi:MAG: Ferric siderophore transport system, periplasmic binding protein TonB [Betaproteobacteria bacterium]|nr:Ferric siderophore transport system, periplasmic binding protein TonB [Betaproteobacteria bacterium]
MELSSSMTGWRSNQRGTRYAGLLGVVALHAVALVALLHYEPARIAFTEAMPIMVSLITPEPVVEKPKEPPKPLRVTSRVQKPTPPQQIITTTAAPEPVAAPTPPPPAPSAPVAVTPPPQPAPVTVAPPPVIPPNFNANYLDNPAPAYPPLSRRMGEQGKVMLRVLVNTKGTADKVELRSSSGSSRLDDAALEAVQRWRFVPAKQGDQPVAAWVLIPISFSLKG